MFLQDQAQPVDDFLSRLLFSAQQEASRISADSITNNIQNLTSNFIKRFEVKPIELAQPVAKINADIPTIAKVTWEVKGTIALAGLADSTGLSLDLKKNAQNLITKSFEYPSPITGNEELQKEIKQNIAATTERLTKHFTSLNTAVAAINRELRSEIPKFIEERVKFVNRTRAAEDFLNN